MLRGVLRVRETARGFDDDLNAEGTPVEFRRVFDCEDFDPARPDDDGIAVDFYVFVQSAENGIVLREMGERLRVGEIVDRDELDVRIVQGGANHVASNAAEAVDANFYGHDGACSPSGIGSYGELNTQDSKGISGCACEFRCRSLTVAVRNHCGLAEP